MLELSLKEYDGSLLKSSQKEVLSEYMDMTQVRHKQVSKWLFFKGGNYQRDNLSRFKKNLQTSETQCFWGFSFIYNCIRLW